MTCNSCKYWDRELDQYPCNKCIHNSLDYFKPMTNFDKIKAMSVEELARFLANPCECEVDPGVDGYVECGNELCIKRLIKWLESEVS